MTTIINGSSPSITFSDSTTQASAGLTAASPTITSGSLTFPDATTQSSAGLTSSASQVSKAWVKFTGSTINSSYNVSSITVNGTGDFTVNMTNALTDSNYAIVGTAVSNLSAINPAILTPKVGGTLTTSAFQIQCAQYNGSLVANTSVGVAVFR